MYTSTGTLSSSCFFKQPGTAAACCNGHNDTTQSHTVLRRYTSVTHLASLGLHASITIATNIFILSSCGASNDDRSKDHPSFEEESKSIHIDIMHIMPLRTFGKHYCVLFCISPIALLQEQSTMCTLSNTGANFLTSHKYPVP